MWGSWTNLSRVSRVSWLCWLGVHKNFILSHWLNFKDWKGFITLLYNQDCWLYSLFIKIYHLHVSSNFLLKKSFQHFKLQSYFNSFNLIFFFTPSLHAGLDPIRITHWLPFFLLLLLLLYIWLQIEFFFIHSSIKFEQTRNKQKWVSERERNAQIFHLIENYIFFLYIYKNNNNSVIILCCCPDIVNNILLLPAYNEAKHLFVKAFNISRFQHFFLIH